MQRHKIDETPQQVELEFADGRAWVFWLSDDMPYYVARKLWETNEALGNKPGPDAVVQQVAALAVSPECTVDYLMTLGLRAVNRAHEILFPRRGDEEEEKKTDPTSTTTSLPDSAGTA